MPKDKHVCEHGTPDCCMPGMHLAAECCTPEMMEMFNESMDSEEIQGLVCRTMNSHGLAVPETLIPKGSSTAEEMRHHK